MLKSREAMADADVVLVVVDAAVGMGEEDAAVVAGLRGRACIVVWNKSDLVAGAGSEELIGREPGGPDTEGETGGGSGLAVSALTGAGVGELRRAIVALATGGGGAAGVEAMLTNLRQHQAVSAAVEALMRARAAVAGGIPHEMVLLDLYEGLQRLDSLTGVTSADDVLRLIFSRFCIGK